LARDLAKWRPTEARRRIAEASRAVDLDPAIKRFAEGALACDAKLAAQMGAAFNVTSLFEPLLAGTGAEPQAAGRVALEILVPDVDNLPWEAITPTASTPAVTRAPATAVQLVRGETDVQSAVVAGVAPGVDLVAGHRDLSKVELTLAGEMKREEYLARVLRGAVEGYDFVVIDCPPNLGLLTVNALCATPEVIAPMSMLDPGALQGAGELRPTVARLADQNVDVRIAVVLRTCAGRVGLATA
jgi:hypothetical protein